MKTEYPQIQKPTVLHLLPPLRFFLFLPKTKLERSILDITNLAQRSMLRGRTSEGWQGGNFVLE
ncbi:hypothetical protein KJA17_00390 [Patescibacteria group bacterium]|nr:hypothetical protein [Patescibacteria group bacterium]